VCVRARVHVCVSACVRTWLLTCCSVHRYCGSIPMVWRVYGSRVSNNLVSTLPASMGRMSFFNLCVDACMRA
jgi:hypothetical protein